MRDLAACIRATGANSVAVCEDRLPVLEAIADAAYDAAMCHAGR
jgi:hypothetical protein